MSYLSEFISIIIPVFNESQTITILLDSIKNIELINNISKEIAANIIENISGDKLNESSIKAAVEEISKTNVGKYL